MQESDCCPWCSNTPETLHHAFFSCPAVRDLWYECECTELIVDEQDFDFKQTLLDWMQLNAKKCLVGVALLWQIWYRRNQMVFNKSDTPHLVVKDRVVRLVEDCGKYASKIYGSAKKKKCKSSKKWLPPPPNFIKINCDASLKDDGWVGLGAAARDELGEILFAGVRRIRGYWPPEVAECKALHFGVKLAQRYGYRNVIMESDCQLAVTRLSKAATFFTDLDSVLDDIIALSSSFDYISWSHVRRDGNYVAHHLSSLVPFGVEQVWENFCPHVIAPYVLMDKLSID